MAKVFLFQPYPGVMPLDFIPDFGDVFCGVAH
jgi:hypothetical protein